MGAVSRDPGRRWNPRSLGGARARSRVYGSESWRSPGARWGLRRASGSRQAPPRSLTFAHQMRMVCGIFFAWECEGGFCLTTRQSRGKGAIRDPARVSKLWEEPPPRAFRPGRCPSVHLAQGQSSACGPPPLAPAGPAPQPQLGFLRRSLPALSRSAAQPSPARIRFRTLAAVAKDRRTPHHPLKIRPLALGTVLPARAGGDTGRQEGAPGPRGGAGSSGAGWRADREFGFGMHGAPQAERARVWPLGPRHRRETPWSPRLRGKDLRGGEMGAGETERHRVGLSGDPSEPRSGCRSPAGTHL